jgi:release factor glutamine methyltransferase
VAKRNVAKLGLDGRVTVVQGDLFEALAEVPDPQPFNLIVSNPPYIPTGELEKLDRNVRDFEPRMALDGGMDGLVVHRRIVEEAPARLMAGGRIYLEIQFDQGPIVKELVETREEFEDARILKDYGGNQRLVTARRK